MNKKLYISLFFSNLVKLNPLSSNHRMYNLYTKFVKILEICKQNFFLEHLWVDNHMRPIVYIYIIPYYLATCLCKMQQNRQ